MKDFKISTYMSKDPTTIAPDSKLSYAIQVIHKNKVHHLPVMDGKKIVGILSERNIRMLQTFVKESLSEISVSDACVEEPFIVKKSESIHSVATKMAKDKISCALVIDDYQLIGIFTWVDALKALANLTGEDSTNVQENRILY